MVNWNASASLTRNHGMAWWILRLAFGIMPIVSGLDKFFNLLVDWSIYLWPFVPETLGIQAETFMIAVGVIEVVAGIGVLSPATRIFAFVVSAWLLAIAVNLIITGYYDIAARDIGLSVGAFVLGMMSPMPQEQISRLKRRRAGTAA